MTIKKIMCYYVICAICSGGFGYLVGSSRVVEPPKTPDPIDVIFELCYHGAPIIRNGLPYMVNCTPMRFF